MADTFPLLPKLLSEVALKESTPVSQTVVANHDEVTARTEAVQRILRSFATEEALWKEISTLRSVTRRPIEDEMDFYVRPTEASNRFGTCNTMDEQRNTFIEGRNPNHRSFVCNTTKVPRLGLSQG